MKQEEVPEREKWLFENEEALAQVREGIKQSAEGRAAYLGSFAKYLNKGES